MSQCECLSPQEDRVISKSVNRKGRERVYKILERNQFTLPHVDVKRAKYFTESMKETEGELLTLRWAKALKNVAEKITVWITPDQLLAGRVGKLGRYGILYPEIDGVFYREVLADLEHRDKSPFQISQEDIKTVMEDIAPYWEGKTYHEHLNKVLPEDIRSVTCAVCVSDSNGIVVLVNRRYSELTGLAKKEVIGKRLDEMVKNGIFDTVLNARVVKSGENVASVQHLYNGLVLMLDGHPIKDESGQVIYVVTIIRDITALAELREALTAQKELLETFHNHYDDTACLEIPQYPRVLHSSAIRRIYGEASAIVKTDATVLLLGETVTGKDVMARNIHNASKRASGPFIKLDCGAIPENLIESELFGYAPGSFSGASKQGKAGLVEAANSGTLFLDEIGELPLSLQSRLLRVLQDREVLRLGAITPKKVDVRVIAATNKDLEKEMQKGAFRIDLYYRLKVAVLNLPPLRKRKADILPLTQGFLNYYGKKYNKAARLSPEVEQILEEHISQGNVRELENLIQGALLKCKKGIIEAGDLVSIGDKVPFAEKEAPSLPIPCVGGPSFKSVIHDLEKKIIEAGLRKYGTMEEVAKNLQMDRRTIFRKMRLGKADMKEEE